MKKVIKLTENDLHKIVKDSVMKILKENDDFGESFDFYDFVDILDRNGYAYSNYYSVKSKDGRTGIRYEIEPNSANNKTTGLETLKRDLINAGGADRFVFSQGEHRNAPEIKRFSIVVINN